jgi:Domain of unknown function (DUF4345)
MRGLRITVRILCLIPLLTGVIDFALSTNALATLGVALPKSALEDPSLNSQMRFFAAIWFGFGLMLWVAAGDPVRYSTWFKLMGWILILSGIGRLISTIQFGLPVPPFVAAMVLELAGVPLLLWWHARLTKNHGVNNSASST